MRSSKRSPFSPTGPAASNNAHSAVHMPRVALLREGGAKLQPPPSLPRSGRCQLSLAASSPAPRVPERDDAKDGLTSVLVKLALCVFVGLVVSAGLATSRGLRAAEETGSGQLKIAEPAAAVMGQKAPGVAANARPWNDGPGRAWNSMTSGGGRRTRPPQLEGDYKRRRNASARVFGPSWEATLELREWTADLPQSPTSDGDTATLSSGGVSALSDNEAAGATATFERTVPESTRPGPYREVHLPKVRKTAVGLAG